MIATERDREALSSRLEFQLKSTSLYDCNQDAAQKLLDEMVSVEVNLSV